MNMMTGLALLNSSFNILVDVGPPITTSDQRVLYIFSLITDTLLFCVYFHKSFGSIQWSQI